MSVGDIKVSREFMEAFSFCMKYYEVTGSDLAFEKERVRENYAEAERCYLSIAGGIGVTGNKV